MFRDIKTDELACTIKVVISTPKSEKLWIKICDANAPKTYYSKRYARVNGTETYYIGLPESENISRLLVYKDGQTPLDNDGYKVKAIEILPLKSTKRIPMSRKTKAFVKFAQEFSEEASYLPASMKGESYFSDNGKFQIDYYDQVRSKADNKPIKTPARISQLTGRIEVSKKAFERYSIPMRMAILLHEYSHYYINKTPSSEVEADLNGLKIYLALGYPRIDAYNVFLNVFKSANSKQSLNRFEKLDAFIKNWEYGK